MVGAAATAGTERELACYKKGGLRVAEQWLDEPLLHPTGCDVLLLHQYSRAPKGAFSSPFTTLVVDLTQSEDALLQGLNRDTKYKVRRAETKDEVICVQEPAVTDEVCLRLKAFYDEFAAAKGVAQIPAEELLARGRAGALRVSRAEYRGETVVWHAHAATDERATLLYSASHFRQLDDNDTKAAIGRANRLLHWKDMLAFRAEGHKVYDFGGWYAGNEDRALLSINQFKEGFGGVRADQVNGAIALSWRGWVFLRLRQALSPAQRKRLKQRLSSLLRR